MKNEVGVKSEGRGNGVRPIRLMLAYLCVATEKEASLDRKVEILDRFELTDKEIAKVCKSALQSIRNARQIVKKHGSSPKKAKQA
jgi:hypothetical protein